MRIDRNADLTTMLAALQIDDPIPIAAFAVVADVLFAILSASQSPHAGQESIP